MEVSFNQTTMGRTLRAKVLRRNEVYMKFQVPVLVMFGLTCVAPRAFGQKKQTPIASVAPSAEIEFRVELHRLVPSSVSVVEGSYRIRIINGVYTAPLDYALHEGNSPAAVTASSKVAGADAIKTTRAHLEGTLHPGPYVLVIAGHPDLYATITVTPQEKAK